MDSVTVMDGKPDLPPAYGGVCLSRDTAKQILERRICDLNEVIAGYKEMLRVAEGVAPGSPLELVLWKLLVHDPRF